VTDSELTTTILRQIRDELVKTNARLDTTNERLDNVTIRLDNLTDEAKGTNERLTVVETVLRDVAAQVVFIGRYVKNKQDAAISDLRKRIVKLEKKVG
jgi:septal ring factor EnvC (AmiA/AmiB activator)